MTVRRRGIMLVELMVAIVPAMVLVALLLSSIASFVYAQRQAAEHRNRLAVIDSLIARLQSDAVSTREVHWPQGNGGVGRLELRGDDGVTRYEIMNDRIELFVDDEPTTAWSSPRLQFAAELRTGRGGAVLLLRCIEQPSVRGRLPGDRVLGASIYFAASVGEFTAASRDTSDSYNAPSNEAEESSNSTGDSPGSVELSPGETDEPPAEPEPYPMEPEVNRS